MASGRLLRGGVVERRVWVADLRMWERISGGVWSWERAGRSLSSVWERALRAVWVSTPREWALRRERKVGSPTPLSEARRRASLINCSFCGRGSARSHLGGRVTRSCLSTVWRLLMPTFRKSWQMVSAAS